MVTSIPEPSGARDADEVRPFRIIIILKQLIFGGRRIRRIRGIRGGPGEDQGRGIGIDHADVQTFR